MSTFQRRHFVAIAAILAQHRSPGLPEAFAGYLATLNGQFDRRRFLEACAKPGLTKEERAATVRKIEED